MEWLIYCLKEITMITNKVEELSGIFTKDVDKDFSKRVWNSDPSIYTSRLRAIDFQGMKKVLDAGCGMGQWLYALSQINDHVTGVEYDKQRSDFTKKLMGSIAETNTRVMQGSVEQLDFPDDTFDAVFSYSVILCTDYRKALKEFYRVLKPGGKLYFNTNGLGWYIYNLIHTHNDSKGFSSREMAEVAIKVSLHYYATNEFKRGKYAAIITPQEVVMSDLSNLGFKNIISAPEGTINLKNETIRPFFKGEYEGLEGVTEYLCAK